MTTLPRRSFLGAGAIALAAGRLLRGAETNPALMIVRSPSPVDLEMPLEGFSEAITPVERFFVRCHTDTPKLDLKKWHLEIAGNVNRPLTLSMAELKKLPRYELVGVLECAGNGRAFYQPRMPGAQWTHGAVGNARWAGVRLSDVLQRAGLKASAVEVLFDGADKPMGNMEDLRRSIPIKKALDPDTLLAYEMNGQPLTPLHGFPLRVVAPGWAGDSWIKWLTRIDVLDREFDGFWMKTAYRYPMKPTPPGAAVDPSQTVPVTDLMVKSVIATPTPGLLSGFPVKISGAAWSNSSPVASVEVSADGGKTWNAAKLGQDLGRYSWRLWETAWTPPANGEYTLLSRARNAAGDVQPLEQRWNPSGYLWNVSPRVTVRAGWPEGYRTACLSCHDEHLMQQQRLTRAQWQREIDKMVKWGAPVKPEHNLGILEYLANTFK